ncbi:hypothetical protein D3C73_1162510 [compost metagenome]
MTKTISSKKKETNLQWDDHYYCDKNLNILFSDLKKASKEEIIQEEFSIVLKYHANTKLREIEVLDRKGNQLKVFPENILKTTSLCYVSNEQIKRFELGLRKANVSSIKCMISAAYIMHIVNSFNEKVSVVEENEKVAALV